MSESLKNLGYEDILLFENISYDTALIGVTVDSRAVYDYDKMVEWLVKTENLTVEKAVDWIELNTISTLSCYGNKAPIIFHRTAFEEIEIIRQKTVSEVFEKFKTEMRSEIARNEQLFAEDKDDFYAGRNDAFRTAINYLAQLTQK